MPRDVIMPALGMAQDSGHLVAWHKAPGDAVSEGDVLFEVETDKATMEVEAQGAGFLADVAAAEGEDVPVGRVIARIVETADEAAASPAAGGGESDGSSGGGSSGEEPDGGSGGSGGSGDTAAAEDLPAGHRVIMPALGMAQDSGRLVAWSVAPGTRVGAEDTLFEVETDKSVMEVPAGAAGWLAATLAEPGEDVPTGQTIAIVSDAAPERTIARSAAAAPDGAAAGGQPSGTGQSSEKSQASGTEQPSGKSQASGTEQPSGTGQVSGTSGAPGTASGRILASPKARRLAAERGLDLARLRAAGHPEPYHVADLETLAALPAETPAAAPAAGPGAGAAAPARRLTAEAGTEALEAFVAWAGEAGIDDPGAVLAGFAAAGLPGRHGVVALEAHGVRRVYRVPAGARLGAITRAGAEGDDAAAEAAPALLLRDLRGTALTGVALGPEAVPVLTLAGRDGRLEITLECAADQLEAADALALLADFAGRLDAPLRHLL